MSQTSAGLLMYRRRAGKLEFLLVHPGGPFYAKKDEGVWGIPKGLVEDGEDHFAGAKREFQEETGLEPQGTFLELGTVTQKSGKVVHAWAFEGDCDPATIKSNTFKMEWPPKSGKIGEFPEVDRGEFFTYEKALLKINPAQIEFLDQLTEKLTFL